MPPVTLAEFTLGGYAGNDFYDVSLVDGFNIPMKIRPQGGSGSCRVTSCKSDVNAVCPNELKVSLKHLKNLKNLSTFKT